jgi:PAS domain S-box-containing protein
MTKNKLLVLDDEARILSSIEDLFEDDNEVLTTSDPAKALQLLQQQDVAVILTDERMPGLTGHEFLQKAREFSRATRIMISGYADAKALTDAVNAGQIFAYIAKPWEPLAFRETVRAAIVHFELIQAIERERELLRVLMESIPDPIYFKDAASRFIRINREHARALGAANPEECVGKMDSDFLEHEYATRSYRDEQNIVQSGNAIFEQIEKLKMPDGRRRWMSTTKVPILATDGQVSGLACVCRDITNLKEIEESLRNESALLQLLQAVTVAANESSTIEQAARTCLQRICSHTGCGVGHVWLLEGGSDDCLISTDIWHLDPAEAYESFRSATADGCTVTALDLPGRIFASGMPDWVADINELDGSSRTGEGRLADLRSCFGLPLLAGKKVMGVLEFFSAREMPVDEDLVKLMIVVGSQLGQVVVRQNAKEQLEHATRSAESANRAKSEFLTSMSHEIRTPLNALLGMAELLAATSLNPDQRSLVSVFQRGGAKLLTLVNDLLDLSKVESGHSELHIAEFDLRTVLERAKEITSHRAESKGLRLTVDVLPGVLPQLTGDPDRLHQVLVNLLGNAIKFTQHGDVCLRVEIDPALPGPSSLRFSVIDSGIGIAHDKMNMIFDRFTRIDSSVTRKYEGTGLGLAIAKELVNLMGGQIGVSSEIGKGSTFWFTIRFGIGSGCPRPEPSTADLSRASRAGNPVVGAVRTGPATRVLAVDDSDDNLLLVKAFLAGSGVQLDLARNGWEGVEKVLSGDYDLVLMDIQMPVMDGHTATRVIRLQEEERQSPPVPILALTAHAAQDAKDKSSQSGCTGHLTKPIDQATLLDAVSRYARRQPAAR